MTVRELELNIQMLEEDKERVQVENTMLFEEIQANEQIHDTEHARSKSRKRESQLGANIKQLKDQIKQVMKENERYKIMTVQLRSKAAKLKDAVQKAESKNQGNIAILQTQFEKENNKWEQEKAAYQQEIINLKRKVYSLSHMLQKYQHNEMLMNTSCFSCAFTPSMIRMPFGVLGQCNQCMQRNANGHCACNAQMNTFMNTQEKFTMDGTGIKQCLRQSYAFPEGEKSFMEAMNPLLTLDSRQNSNKVLTTYCETSKKSVRANMRPAVTPRNFTRSNLLETKESTFDKNSVSMIKDMNKV